MESVEYSAQRVIIGDGGRHCFTKQLLGVRVLIELSGLLQPGAVGQHADEQCVNARSNGELAAIATPTLIDMFTPPKLLQKVSDGGDFTSWTFNTINPRTSWDSLNTLLANP